MSLHLDSRPQGLGQPWLGFRAREEATIAPDNFVAAIPRQCNESVVARNYRVIRQTWVAHHRGDCTGRNQIRRIHERSLAVKLVEWKHVPMGRLLRRIPCRRAVRRALECVD